MTKTEKLQEQMEATWTVEDVAEKAQVTTMTVYNWRGLEQDPLPAVVIPGRVRPALRFVPNDVINWCKRHQIKLHGIDGDEDERE